MDVGCKLLYAAAGSKEDISLELKSFGVAYVERTVLSSVSLDVRSTGIVALVGPAGTGKSTLLRTLAGFNRSIPALRTWGSCLYRGLPLGDDNRPVLVSQNSKLLASTLLENLLYETPERFASSPAEKRDRALGVLRSVGLESLESDLHLPVVQLPLVVQRLVAIARLLQTSPSLLCIDEPTYGLAEEEAEKILAVAKLEAQRRAVMIVLHNQREIRSLDGMLALLAGGIVQEYRPIEEFFAEPVTQAGREFRDTGTCSEPSPDALEEDLSTGVRPRLRAVPAHDAAPSGALGPRGFAWLLPGKLAGTPRPGVVADIEYDLQALKRVGVSILLSLTVRPLDQDVLRLMGMRAYWYPIPDMGAPTLTSAKEICRLIERLLNNGATIAVHCRAGLGRTGTILAAYLIWCGQSAVGALEEVRRIQPRWVQSDTQVRFLEEFAKELSHRQVTNRFAFSENDGQTTRREID